MALHSINANKTEVQMVKTGGFGVSDCWNYTLNNDERLTENYALLKVYKSYAKHLNVSIDVIVAIGNSQRAIKHERQKHGLPRIPSTPIHVHSMKVTITKKNKKVIQAAFLSNLETILFLMLNDYNLRSQKKA